MFGKNKKENELKKERELIGDNKLFTVRIPLDLHHEFKVLCVKNNHSMTDVVEKSIRAYIKKNKGE